MGLFFLLIILFMLFGMIAAALRVVRWITSPFETMARSRRLPNQFTVLDVLILFAMLQCTVGTVHYMATRGVEPGSAAARDAVASAFAGDAVAAVFFFLCWCCGVSMASQAGIGRWWHRVIILGFVAPGTTIGVPVTVGLTLAVIFLVGEGGLNGVPAVIGMLCLAWGVVGACGAVTRWIAGKYPPCQAVAKDAPLPDSSPFEE